MLPTINLAQAETAPFALTPAHELLAEFAGHFRGPTKLWLEPGAAPEESIAELHAELILGGRWLRISYRSAALQQPHAGEMLLGYHKDAAKYELAWIDSFHTGSAIMLCAGSDAESKIVNVLGSYYAAGQKWGWRTRFSKPTADQLLIESFNVTPDGTEERALEWMLTRS